MDKITCLLIILIFPVFLFSATLVGKVTTKDFPLGAAGVNVLLYYKNGLPTKLGAATDAKGNFVIKNIPDGVYEVHFDYVGYRSEVREISLKGDSTFRVNVHLVPQVVKGKEVFVTASVTKREVSVSNTPIRVEIMVPEEVQDKVAFATKVNDALNYSGGIITIRSKNVLESENLRLHGIDSRYLLLLSDQMPILGFQPEMVGIWTVPLISVKKIEVVKGDYSALYGLGNAGVINTVMRNPFNDDAKAFGLLRLGMFDQYYFGLYGATKGKNNGLSGVLSLHAELSDSSISKNIVLLQRFDRRDNKFKAFASLGFFGQFGYESRADLRRLEGRLSAERNFYKNIKLQLKSNAVYQLIGSHEIVKLAWGAVELGRELRKLHFLAGIDFYSEGWSFNDSLKEKSHRLSLSTFYQLEWSRNEKLTLLLAGRLSNYYNYCQGAYRFSPSGGFRKDSVSYNYWGVNMMMSLLWKPKYNFNLRLSSSIATSPILTHYYDSIKLVPSLKLHPVHFKTASFDAKYISSLNSVSVTSNISFFVTKISNHIDVFSDSSGIIYITNAPSAYIFPGLEFFSRIDLSEDAYLLLGYTYIKPNDAYKTSGGTMLPLPHHQANVELDWEIENTGLRFEFEGKVLGSQVMSRNPLRKKAPPYSVWGGTIEYSIYGFRVFFGAENIFDFRQTDSGILWGPKEGREIYIGVKKIF